MSNACCQPHGSNAEVIALNTKVKQKAAIKVYVRMHDGSRLLGSVFLGPDERLQDIMNDDRSFIPVHVEEQKSISLVMLSKRYIQQIEEVQKEERRIDTTANQLQRRAPVPKAAARGRCQWRKLRKNRCGALS